MFFQIEYDGVLYEQEDELRKKYELIRHRHFTELRRNEEFKKMTLKEFLKLRVEKLHAEFDRDNKARIESEILSTLKP